MHPNPVFHDADTRRNLDFARERGFGVLAVNGEALPMLSHVPFLLNADGTEAELHLVRSNPIARALETPRTARLAVSAGDTYVSPDWYEMPDQVPTWNYVAVQIDGTLERLPDGDLNALLDRQSAFYEARLAPKPAWTTAKMTPDVMARMMRQIVPCRLRITAVDGTWKLSQNKPDTARRNAARQVAAYGFGLDARALAALMLGRGEN